MHDWRDHELLARALDVFGLASLAERRRRPPKPSRWPSEREAAA